MAAPVQVAAVALAFLVATALPGVLWLLAFGPRAGMPWPERFVIGTGLGLATTTALLLAARFALALPVSRGLAAGVILVQVAAASGWLAFRWVRGRRRPIP